MKYKIRIVFLLGSLLLMGVACGDDGADFRSSVQSGKDDGHVWKETTDTLDRARQAERQLLDAAEKQRQAIDEQM